MRLWLSDKASKQLRGEVPPAEFLECEAHGKQAYVRIPEELVEAMGVWGCGECVRQAGAREREAREAKRRQEEEAREAKKAAKKAAKEAVEKADAALQEALAEAQEVNGKVRAVKQKLRDRRRRLKFAQRSVEERRAQLEEIKALLAEAEAELKQAEAAVPPLEEKLAAERGELAGYVERLRGALLAADEAWKAIPPKQRKRRNRRARHQAVQLVEAHAPPGSEPVAAEGAREAAPTEDAQPADAASLEPGPVEGSASGEERGAAEPASDDAPGEAAEA